MLKVGLTGGIGSGKSTVSLIFEQLGVPVYNADQRAKFLIQTNKSLQESILSTFGEKSFTRKGYNRTYIASIVFKDSTLLSKLNQLIHPKVAADFTEWTLGINNREKYIIHEAAILAESGTSQLMDKIIVVDAPVEKRIQRVCKRDNISKEAVLARMKNQWSTEKIRSIADWIVENDDNTLILPQILKIHTQLKYSIS